MGLRILVDTNVLLDYLLCRSPYDRAAEQIVVACKQRRVSGCIAAAFQADYIVTRNCADFKSSGTPCIEPAEFCKMLSE